MNRFSPVSKPLAGAAFAMVAAIGRTAGAEPPPPVDVVLHETPPPRRVVAIEWNPLALLVIGKVSANVVIVPTDHHALVLSPFYASTTTAPIWVYDPSGLSPTVLPQQTFSGFGGEIGYRYYAGEGGPRGFFVGPSLILASITAKAQNGSKTDFLDYGLAADAGWEALVTDRVAISLGGGLQYTATSKSIPSQQFPAAVYANNGVRPRVLFSLGWAF
jgi:hypothetical protein